MPFGLINAPASIQHFINDILHEYLHVFCTAYIDDILIYSDILEEHCLYARTLLQSIKKAGLYLQLEMCEFHVQQTDWLGLNISTEGISVDPTKVATVKEWASPE